MVTGVRKTRYLGYIDMIKMLLQVRSIKDLKLWAWLWYEVSYPGYAWMIWNNRYE